MAGRREQVGGSTEGGERRWRVGHGRASPANRRAADGSSSSSVVRSMPSRRTRRCRSVARPTSRSTPTPTCTVSWAGSSTGAATGGSTTSDDRSGSRSSATTARARRRSARARRRAIVHAGFRCVFVAGPTRYELDGTLEDVELDIDLFGDGSRDRDARVGPDRAERRPAAVARGALRASPAGRLRSLGDDPHQPLQRGPPRMEHGQVQPQARQPVPQAGSPRRAGGARRPGPPGGQSSPDRRRPRHRVRAR